MGFQERCSFLSTSRGCSSQAHQGWAVNSSEGLFHCAAEHPITTLGPSSRKGGD